MNPSTLWHTFYRFLYDEIRAADLLAWVLAHMQLATAVLGQESADHLRAYDVRQPAAAAELKLLVRGLCELHNPDGWARERVRRVLHDMLNGDMSWSNGCRQLATWRQAGYDFIPDAYLSYVSELDSAPKPDDYPQWNEAALQKKLQAVSVHREELAAQTAAFLQQLETAQQGDGDA